MSIQFKDSAEAIAAITTVIIAADKVGNFADRDTLFEQMRKLDVFKIYDTAKLNRLMADVTQKVYDLLPCNDCVLTDEAFETLVKAAKSVLTPDLQKRTYELAQTLAKTDGISDEEEFLLQGLRKGFSLDSSGSSYRKAA